MLGSGGYLLLSALCHVVPVVWGGGHSGYDIPHFGNFSALFPQIRRQELAISTIL